MEISKLARHKALEVFLSDWSVEYDEVIETLRHETNEFWVSSDKITLWQPFENSAGGFIADAIENLYESFIDMAGQA